MASFHCSFTTPYLLYSGWLDLEHRSAPRVTAAEDRRKDTIALPDLALAAPVVDGERYGCGAQAQNPRT